jgi:hypothetical protein
MARAFRLGRGNLRLLVDTLGKPLPSLWSLRLQLGLAWVRYRVKGLRGPGPRLMAGTGVQYLRGFLAERQRVAAARAG